MLPLPVSSAFYPCTHNLPGIHVNVMQLGIWGLPEAAIIWQWAIATLEQYK